jgi:hypothetical protein
MVRHNSYTKLTNYERISKKITDTCVHTTLQCFHSNLLVGGSPDNFQQNDHNRNDKENVNNTARMITQKTDCPGNHENNSNDVQEITHNSCFR